MEVTDTITAVIITVALALGLFLILWSIRK